MIEQGVDNLGTEFKRTSYDFSFKHLTQLKRIAQNSCICSICHGTGAEYALRYITRDYSSARQKKRICKTLQAHEHSFWICPACVENFTAITGLRVIQAKPETNDPAKLAVSKDKIDAAETVPAIPVPWIEAKIMQLISMDNEFAGLTVHIIKTLLNEWKKEEAEK